MNKGELIEKMAAEAGGSNAESSRYLDAFMATVEDELKSGGEVQIPGFGKFKVNERAAREGRNPATGEKMRIKASKSPSFSAGNTLKEALN